MACVWNVANFCHFRAVFMRIHPVSGCPKRALHIYIYFTLYILFCIYIIFYFLHFYFFSFIRHSFYWFHSSLSFSFSLSFILYTFFIFILCIFILYTLYLGVGQKLNQRVEGLSGPSLPHRGPDVPPAPLPPPWPLGRSVCPACNA